MCVVKRINPIWLLVALNIVFLLLRNVILPEETSAAIENWVEMTMLRIGAFGYIGLVLGFVLCGFFFVPLLIPLNILGGALYGAYPGTIVALLGVTLSTAASTVSARYLFSGMRQKPDEYPRLKYFIALADRNMNLSIILIRFAVVIPYMLQNIALAMTRASIMRITVLTALSAIPGAAIYSFLGAGLMQAEDARELLLYVAVPMLLMLGLTAIMAWSRARERDERELSEDTSASIRDD
ncbi:MAG: VTT domain-containing protein [Gammaproteobacteria bacterium]